MWVQEAQKRFQSLWGMNSKVTRKRRQYFSEWKVVGNVNATWWSSKRCLWALGKGVGVGVRVLPATCSSKKLALKCVRKLEQVTLCCGDLCCALLDIQQRLWCSLRTLQPHCDYQKCLQTLTNSWGQEGKGTWIQLKIRDLSASGLSKVYRQLGNKLVMINYKIMIFLHSLLHLGFHF